VLVALVPEKGLNNGQPSGHAMWLSAADPRPGEHVVHIGAGTGYYTAILAHLVGGSGRITAIEYDASLANRARENLARFSNVVVINADGVVWPFDPADVIYVNAGVARPAETWLDRLNAGGRLVMPLTSHAPPGGVSHGVVFRFEKRGAEFAAQVVSPTGFIPCEGLREAACEAALAQAFANGDVGRVTRLVRTTDHPDDAVWLRGPGWTLLYT
jgi:protein-L-isoaspartate(D-aspartate) O-methyltransferase